MFLKRAVIFLCLVLIDIHHEGAGKSVVASVKGPKKAYRRILWLWKREQKFYSYFKDSALILQQLKGMQHSKVQVLFANESYTKWVPFLSNKVYNRVRGQTSGKSLPI